MPSLVTERIESVKAGVTGAAAFAVAELVFSIIHLVLSTKGSVSTLIDGTWLVQLAIGAVSGFLFGVTYRYVIRGDRNTHLNDGAVLAFGLVRGLAVVEQHLVLSELLSVLFLVTQSIVCFAIARLVLDLAIARKLIKPFINEQ